MLPTQAKRKRSLEKVVEFRTGSCLRSIGCPFQVVGLTIEKEQVCIVVDAVISCELVEDILGMATFQDLSKISFCHI